MKMRRKYIEKVPNLASMIEVHEAIETCRGCLLSLGEGGDVPQRATDLLSVTKDLMKIVKTITTEEC